MVIDRQHAEDNTLGFACDPEMVGDKSYVNMYLHHDGYPGFLGVEIANSLIDSAKIDNLEIEELCAKHGDLDYIYYVWQSKYKSTWISIFNEENDECIFVGEPHKLLEKYD